MEVDKVTLLKRTTDDIEFSLPYGWRKIGRKRKNKDHWDFYLISSDNKKFRSNAEVKRYTENNPNVKCDLSVTNTQFNDSLKNLEIPKPVLNEPKTISFIKTKANTIMPKLLQRPKNGPSSSLSTRNKDKSPTKLLTKPELEEKSTPEFEEEKTPGPLGSNDENIGSESDSDEGFRVPNFMKELKPARQIINKLSPIVKLESLPLGSNDKESVSESDSSDSDEGFRVPDFMKELKPARQIINKLSPIVKLESLPRRTKGAPELEEESTPELEEEQTPARQIINKLSPIVKLDSLPDSISSKKPRFETCGGIKFKKINTGEENEIRKSGRSRKPPARLRDWSSDSDSELTPKKIRKTLKEKSEGVKSEINLNLFNYDDVIEYSLPFGWKKVCKKRKNSDTRNWDVYIINSDGKRFRSTVEVERHLNQNPDEDCDLSTYS